MEILNRYFWNRNLIMMMSNRMGNRISSFETIGIERLLRGRALLMLTCKQFECKAISTQKHVINFEHEQNQLVRIQTFLNLIFTFLGIVYLPNRQKSAKDWKSFVFIFPPRAFSNNTSEVRKSL